MSETELNRAEGEGMTEKTRAPRKPKPKAEVTDSGQAPPADLPTVLGSSLVAYNEVARNSRSVRAVQDVLIERGHWDVRADDSGYWGDYTQAAAEAETGKNHPVEAAEALGFTVLP